MSTPHPAAPRRQRYRLTLEYVGTGFSGWQQQENARTIQGTLLDAAAEIFGGHPVDLQGQGRTDAGVHALDYTAHLESVASRMSPATLCHRFNELLPASIVVLAVTPCDPRFHARLHCIGRSYIYQISRRKSAFQRNFAWWPKDRLDTEAMLEAATCFVGEHDFASFADKPELKKSTTVMVNGVFLEEREELLRLRVVGTLFLWKMVRRMAGLLVEVGRGHLAPDDVAGFLQGDPETPCRFTAPASGLLFERAFYEEKAFSAFLAAAREGAA